MRTLTPHWALLTLSLSVAACQPAPAPAHSASPHAGEQAREQAQPPQTSAAPLAPPTAGPPAVSLAGPPAVSLAGPPAVSPAGPPGMEPVSGDGSPYQAAVLERLATGSYTYYRLRRAADEGWAVTMGEGPVAKAVQVRVMGQRRDFYSRALDRRFDTLQFAIIAAAP